MNDIPYMDWNAMSDAALNAHIGKFIRHHRMARNMTQQQLAAAAGLSRSTLSLLERGEAVMLSSLIQVLRVLDQLQVLDAFSVSTRPSPLQLAKLEKEERQRVRRKRTRSDEDTEDW